MPIIRIQQEDFDLSAETAALRARSSQIGAIAAFVGVVRDVNEGMGVGTMTLEHYPGMTERALEQIVASAAARWSVIDATVIHRIGTLQPSDQIVLVAVASQHRGDAFQACEFIMDYLKTEAPFWKKESTSDGMRWVESRASDAKAVSRWTQKP
jgi:molybdopterin synthase catalytic subunit